MAFSRSVLSDAQVGKEEKRPAAGTASERQPGTSLSPFKFLTTRNIFNNFLILFVGGARAVVGGADQGGAALLSSIVRLTSKPL